MPITKHYVSTMSSISALQGSCNRTEQLQTAKLTSLKAATNTKGVKVTEAIFTEFVGDNSELGKGKITAANGGANTAWIMTVETKVAISRQ